MLGVPNWSRRCPSFDRTFGLAHADAAVQGSVADGPVWQAAPGAARGQPRATEPRGDRFASGAPGLLRCPLKLHRHS
jgi:hypothetical protein